MCGCPRIQRTALFCGTERDHLYACIAPDHIDVAVGLAREKYLTASALHHENIVGPLDCHHLGWDGLHDRDFLFQHLSILRSGAPWRRYAVEAGRMSMYAVSTS